MVARYRQRREQGTDQEAALKLMANEIITEFRPPLMLHTFWLQ
jgi:hypothetical protein